MIPLTNESFIAIISSSPSPLSPCQQSTPIQPQLNFSKQQQQSTTTPKSNSKSQFNTLKSGNFLDFKASEMTVIKNGGKVTKSQLLNSYEVNKYKSSLFIVTLSHYFIEHAIKTPIRL